MMISESNPEQLKRANNGILADIWDALRKEDAVRSLDLGSLSIKVQNGDVYLNGYLKEENLPLIESIVYSVVGVVEVHNHLRTNDGILADIWDALRKEDAVRSLDISSISIQVKNGEVYLNGHLAQEDNLLRIESIAGSIVGVAAVHNNLVTDDDLIIQVSQALARDERTRPFILPVCAYHGWIHLGGVLPTRELQQVAEKVAAEVSNVRGVIALPWVTGASQDLPQHAVQPRIGSVVYGENEEEGVVTRVVIQPDGRLVTHVVVRFNEIRDVNLVARETIVPVTAIDLVNVESLFLVRNGRRLAKPAHTLNAYPDFDPDDYSLAPFTWKAPFPYTAGEVLWSLREILDEDSLPGSRPEIKPGTESEGAPDRMMAQAGV